MRVATEQMNKYVVSHLSSYVYPKAPKLSFASAFEYLWIIL